MLGKYKYIAIKDALALFNKNSLLESEFVTLFKLSTNEAKEAVIAYEKLHRIAQHDEKIANMITYFKKVKIARKSTSYIEEIIKKMHKR